VTIPSTEIEDMAADASIDRALVRLAARELAVQPVTVPPAGALGIAAGRRAHNRRELPDAARELLAGEPRRSLHNLGREATVGRTWTWETCGRPIQGQPPSGRRVVQRQRGHVDPVEKARSDEGLTRAVKAAGASPAAADDLRESTHRRYEASRTMKTPVPPITLEDFNLEAAERRLCVEALGLAGNIMGAAQILGITRHALKRRIIKLEIRWPRTAATEPEVSG
jgi:DNA-binding NtrC family response regulator